MIIVTLCDYQWRSKRWLLLLFEISIIHRFQDLKCLMCNLFIGNVCVCVCCVRFSQYGIIVVFFLFLIALRREKIIEIHACDEHLHLSLYKRKCYTFSKKKKPQNMYLKGIFSYSEYDTLEKMYMKIMYANNKINLKI